MKRELKFRAWNETDEKMYDMGFHINPSGGVEHHVHYWNELPQLTLMQYTGLKDRNGKEIYEGDVIEFGGNNDRGEVIWEVGDAMYIVKCKDYFSQLRNSLNTHKGIFVVGNVWENPDLLTNLK